MLIIIEKRSHLQNAIDALEKGENAMEAEGMTLEIFMLKLNKL